MDQDPAKDQEKAQEKDKFMNEIKNPLIESFVNMSRLGRLEDRVKNIVGKIVTTLRSGLGEYPHISPKEALEIMFDEIRILSHSINIRQDQGVFRETIYEQVAIELAKWITAEKPVSDGDKETENIANGVADAVHRESDKKPWPEI